MGLDAGLLFRKETLFATKPLLLHVYTVMTIGSEFPGRTLFSFTCEPLSAFARLRFSLLHEYAGALLILAPSSGSGHTVETA